MPLLINGEEMAEAIAATDLIEAMRGVSLERAEGKVSVPPRITADAAGDNGWLRVGPALLNGSGVMGFKSMNRRPRVGMRYMVALYSIETGELLALVDANLLTTARTAATNALGTHLLAPAGARTLGVVGSGFQADAAIAEIYKLRDFERVVLFSPRQSSRERFAAVVEERTGRPVTIVESAEQVAAACDALLLAFRAPTEPVLRAGWLRPGMHVTGLSSVRPEAREVDDETWTRCDVVVIDDAGSVRQSGDGRSLIAAGGSIDDQDELWQLVSGAVPGRVADEQISMFKSSGNSEQDIAAAAAVFSTALEMGLGRDLGEFPEVKPYD